MANNQEDTVGSVNAKSSLLRVKELITTAVDAHFTANGNIESLDFAQAQVRERFSEMTAQSPLRPIAELADRVAVASKLDLTLLAMRNATYRLEELLDDLEADWSRLAARDDSDINDVDSAIDSRYAEPAHHLLNDTTRIAQALIANTHCGYEALVDSWPKLSSTEVFETIAHLSIAERRQLALHHPRECGNTYGVPWALRSFSNAISIRAEHHRHQMDGERWSHRLDRLETMLRRIEDPTSTEEYRRYIRRRFVAFSPDDTGRMVELIGELTPQTQGLAVYVPGTGSNLDMSHVNTAVAVNLVSEGAGALAALIYMDGEFPQNVIKHSYQAKYARFLAPRLVRFGIEVDREVFADAPGTPVTYIGHSYGGLIVGTAEKMGLRAERTIYVESPGAGLGVRTADDWNNPCPSVQRFSLTAPADPIEISQWLGNRGAVHGSDPDAMAGVVRLDTGFDRNGVVLFGTRAHGAVFEDQSTAFLAITAVVLGTSAPLWVDRRIKAKRAWVCLGSDGKLLPQMRNSILGVAFSDSYDNPRVLAEARPTPHDWALK